jgi:hypothetical protein
METSLQTDIPYYICYRFIRTMMERISSFSSKPHNVKLTGVIETDEFYIKAGLKGRPYHDEIFNSGRPPRKRGLKALIASPTLAGLLDSFTGSSCI